jgi:hypothetical protein
MPLDYKTLFGIPPIQPSIATNNLRHCVQMELHVTFGELYSYSPIKLTFPHAKWASREMSKREQNKQWIEE